jgi:hypothetical protein
LSTSVDREVSEIKSDDIVKAVASDVGRTSIARCRRLDRFIVGEERRLVGGVISCRE